MVQVTGRYQYVSGENFEEYLQAIGQYETAKPFLNAQPIIEISQNGDQWVVTIESNGKTAVTTFKLGEEYDENMPSFSGTLKSFTTKEGDGFVTETKLASGVKSIRNYKFTDTHMTVHLTESKSGVKATRTYKRL
ncbi:PREDICTED: fatty acid-binding protein, adipocyte-like [Polistes dominula]|uniref:Fatty acid-binding protein, adipocyte-like n=1 Tax=Polistes dominula TaxID=743375 RepID=A0ABM1HVT7_POLDO|nr:PREDICTED: fatty acid-binding protein, adipocyte-like [Polistes dominula]